MNKRIEPTKDRKPSLYEITANESLWKQYLATKLEEYLVNNPQPYSPMDD